MKILSCTLMLILLSGCTTNNSIIEKYINDNFYNVQSLQIIEVAEPDSAYSPYRQLLSLDYFYNAATTKMLMYSVQAFEEKNKKKAILLLDSALSIYDSISNQYDSITHKCFLAVDFPNINTNPKNRIFINAKYRINGKLEEQRFYFNENENKIGHCENDIKKAAQKLLQSMEELDNEREKVQKDKKIYTLK